MGCYSWHGDTLTLQVHVQPRASRNEIVGPHGDALKVRITAPPVEGKANAHLIQFLAKTFRVPKSHITLASGEASRCKVLRIQSPQSLPPPLQAP